MEKKTTQTKYDGKIAVIIDKQHPHFTARAKCLGAELTNIGWGMKFIRTDTQEEFFVFDGKCVDWLD